VDLQDTVSAACDGAVEGIITVVIKLFRSFQSFRRPLPAVQRATRVKKGVLGAKLAGKQTKDEYDYREAALRFDASDDLGSRGGEATVEARMGYSNGGEWFAKWCNDEENDGHEVLVFDSTGEVLDIARKQVEHADGF